MHPAPVTILFPKVLDVQEVYFVILVEVDYAPLQLNNEPPFSQLSSQSLTQV